MMKMNSKVVLCALLVAAVLCMAYAQDEASDTPGTTPQPCPVRRAANALLGMVDHMRTQAAEMQSRIQASVSGQSKGESFSQNF